MDQQQQQSGQQQSRAQPLYDITQGGHYGESAPSACARDIVARSRGAERDQLLTSFTRRRKRSGT